LLRAITYRPADGDIQAKRWVIGYAAIPQGEILSRRHVHEQALFRRYRPPCAWNRRTRGYAHELALNRRWVAEPRVLGVGFAAAGRRGPAVLVVRMNLNILTFTELLAMMFRLNFRAAQA
jgi:hypothetical protein